jgi:hypothetical protein
MRAAPGRRDDPRSFPTGYEMNASEKLQHYGLEFLTVFLGVTLSLVAENFRQHRSDLAAEHNSMVQLHSDLGNEQRDMALNLGHARVGLQSARFLIGGVAGRSADSISAALTGLGQCSFFIPYTSEYTALKSSGRLSVIEDPRVRESIVRFYEGDAFVQWLHERDCTLTGELMDSLLGRLEFAVPTPDTTGRGGRGLRGGRGGGRDTIPNMMAVLSEDSRYPRVFFHAGQDAVIADPAMRDRLVRLATQRRYLITYLQTRIQTVQQLRDTLKSRLGSDTIAIRQGNLSRNRGANPVGANRR